MMTLMQTILASQAQTPTAAAPSQRTRERAEANEANEESDEEEESEDCSENELMETLMLRYVSFTAKCLS